MHYILDIACFLIHLLTTGHSSPKHTQLRLIFSHLTEKIKTLSIQIDNVPMTALKTVWFKRQNHKSLVREIGKFEITQTLKRRR
jgi:hypothetical protein